MANLIDFLKNSVFKGASGTIPAASLKAIDSNPKDKELFKNFGIVTSDLNRALEETLLIGADRRSLYTELEKSLWHPLMSAAVETYADYSTPMSVINNCTIWAEATTEDYQYEIDKLFDILNLEEVIYDWAWTLCFYGDLFKKLELTPGIGITSVDDATHPLDLSRIDLNGRLVGFLDTPQGITQGGKGSLIPPYSYTHCRLLGATKRRSSGILYGSGSPSYSEYRTMSMMVPDQRRISSKYGTSVLNNAIATYKRLKMSEDALLMARVSRGNIKNIFKLSVPKNDTPEAAAALIAEYTETLKRARTLDISGNGSFSDRTNLLTGVEDIILPVFGDANSLQVEKLGGEVDIRSIVDIEELRNQLATAVRVPLPILSGYTKEAPSAMGDGSVADLDIRFARQCHRIQRAIKADIVRTVQIHLAAQGKSPDLKLFEIKMAETSTAAEEEIRNSLDKGVDVSKKIIELIKDVLGDSTDAIEIIEYLNHKILKLNDFEIRKMIKKVEKEVGPLTTPDVNPFEKIGDENNAPNESKEKIGWKKRSLFESISDTKAALPNLKKEKDASILTNENWQKTYGAVTLVEKVEKIKNR
jgi:hypothetical protein